MLRLKAQPNRDHSAFTPRNQASNVPRTAYPSGFAQPLGKDDSPNLVRLPPLAHRVVPAESLQSWGLDRPTSPRGPGSARLLTPLNTETKKLPLSSSPIEKSTVNHHIAKLQAQHLSANFAADVAVSERIVNRRVEEDAKLNEELDELRKKVSQDRDPKTAELRGKKLQIGEQVEIYSHSRQKWCPGVIMKTWQEGLESMVTVDYRDGDQTISKEISTNHRNLRILSSQNQQDRDPKAAEIRGKKMQIGEQVEIYSHSRQKWCPGVVTKAWQEGLEYMVTVDYRDGDQTISKEIATNHPNLRILSLQNQQDVNFSGQTCLESPSPAGYSFTTTNERFAVGDRVKVLNGMESDSKERVVLPKGTTGLVVEVDEVSDICIRFDGFNKGEWIFSEHFGQLCKDTCNPCDLSQSSVTGNVFPPPLLGDGSSWHPAYDTIANAFTPNTGGASSNLQQQPDIDLKRAPSMPLETPSPMVDDGSVNVQSRNSEIQPAATHTQSRAHPFYHEIVSVEARGGALSLDPFEGEMAAVRTASRAGSIEDEVEIRPCPALPCISADMMTNHLYCASKMVGTLAGVRDSSFISSYDEELAYAADVKAGKIKLAEFWSNVDESISRTTTLCAAEQSPKSRQDSECISSPISPQHAAVSVEEATPEEATPEELHAQASKQMQSATWAGDTASLESAIAVAKKNGVSASEISIAEQVLRRETSKKQMEEQLEDAVSSRDVFRLKTSINEAVKSGVMPSKIRAAKLVLRDLEDV